MKAKRKFKKYLETNGNENTTIQNLCDAAKAVLRGKFREMQAFLRKEKKEKKKTPSNTNLAPKRIRKRTNKT